MESFEIFNHCLLHYFSHSRKIVFTLGFECPYGAAKWQWCLIFSFIVMRVRIDFYVLICYFSKSNNLSSDYLEGRIFINVA